MPSNATYDYIIIGSGFGGSVAALRLSEKGYTVAVLEMGRRWSPQTLPKTNWSLSRWLWYPGLGLKGFFRMRLFRHLLVLHGCALGGGSITYANTLLRPKDSIWQSGRWAGLAPWQEEMDGPYATASRMLGVTENKILGPADALLQQAAQAIGRGDTFYRTSVGVFQEEGDAPGGTTYPDPYFGGEGPERTTCTGCGGCMMGCRVGAKNTLDLNYLYLAEKRGAHIHAETRVVDVKPLNGRADGSEGYEVITESSTAFFRKKRQRFVCRGVVIAASALGSMELLFKLRDRGSLPRISPALGQYVRTNCESLIGVRTSGPVDYSQGVAIGSGIYIDDHTHIEATRYPAGSDAMSLMTTLLTIGRPDPSRIFLLLKNLLLSLLRHPLKTWRALKPGGWAKESVIMLCMQALEGHIRMSYRRRWYWPFAKSMQSSGQKIPTFIPEANAFAQTLAQLSGGTAMSMVSEVLFNIPSTAHILGGCVMGRSPEEGVVDHRHRVFGYQNMYICDGSVVSTNLGVNPSLSITALSERAMRFIPQAGQQQWQDAALAEGIVQQEELSA
ncbi:GMC oxidoreductase [Cesiribacter andamanensis]|uniref:Cholesterol oxidase n=1 Tax=Cesiribacter andamanensis AMV16 TaxID=1279009 RepID=M7N2I5_9BACT|nr:GMC family oxidoreductase [Cesiribacter andamanensis]EMR01426.1 Cholesterol oxidase [Cesiribacter andamanensis AMV16]